MRGVGRVERLAKNVLRAIGQMVSDGRREIAVVAVGRGKLSFRR